MSKSCKAVQVYSAVAFGGGKVNFKVAGVYNSANGGGYAQRNRIGYGVVYLYKFNVKGFAESLRVTGENLPQVGIFYSVLRKLQAEYAQSQPRAVNGDFYLLQQIRHRADMVLVSVGENKSAELILVAEQIGEIGYYEVNTGHIVLGEGNAAVYCDNIVAVLEERHIHADPVNTANGYYLKLCLPLSSLPLRLSSFPF